MAVEVSTPDAGGLDQAVDVLRDWQRDGAPWQLHPGDLGWFWRFGAEATAAAVRTWSRDGRLLAVGLLDGPTLLRLTLPPDARRDEELARRLAADVAEPERGVLPAGAVSLEVPADALVRDLLGEDGWTAGEPWTPLCRDLTEPVPDPDVRIEMIGPERAPEWSDVVRASFDRSTFTAERWHAMATGSPYPDARCLLARDGRGTAVAAVAVWSAGPGKPGLLEPMGVHRDHLGRGYGTAISLAAAAVLRGAGLAERDNLHAERQRRCRRHLRVGRRQPAPRLDVRSRGRRAGRGHHQLADQVERLGRMPGSPITAEEASRAAKRLREPATRFTG